MASISDPQYSLQQFIRSAEALACFAMRNNIAVGESELSTLLKATTLFRTAVPIDDAACTAFLAAYRATATACNISPVEIGAIEGRKARVEEPLAGALSLLKFAAANARKIDDGIRLPLLEAADMAGRGTLTLQDEQKLFKAYEGLTVALAPVTAESLRTSTTTLISVPELFSSWRGFRTELAKVTWGRFANAVVFLFVLFLSCGLLNFYTSGSSMLSRYAELQASIESDFGEMAKDEYVARSRQTDLTRDRAGEVKAEAVRLDEDKLAEANLVVDALRRKMDAIKDESITLPDRLYTWSRRPCETWITTLLCSHDEVLPDDKQRTRDGDKVYAARLVAARLSNVFLPLLLGLLGSYAYVLRKITDEFSGYAYVKASLLRYVVRLSLGGMAGIASTWMLSADKVGGAALKDVSTWTLAFIAGYGIELVFSFMDRIVTAFAAKQS